MHDNIRKNLCYEIASRGESQREIARCCNVHWVTLNRYINGKSQIQHTTLERLAKYFGVEAWQMAAPHREYLNRREITA